MSKSLSEVPLVGLNPMELISDESPMLLAQQAQKYGPVLRWTVPISKFAGSEALFLIGPEANRLVMHTQRESFSQEQGYTPAFGDFFGKGLLNMDPPEHTLHRKLWNPAFSREYMERYVPLMQEVIAAHTARWIEKDEIDLHAEARTITFHAAMAALAGFEQDDRIQQVQDLFYKIMGAADPNPQGYEERVAEAMQAKDELAKILLGIIDKRRKLPLDATRDVLGLIVHAHDEEGEGLSNEQILGHFNILLLAGYEATTVVSTYLLYTLATMPEQRQRAENELHAVLGDSTGLISVAATRQMKVMDDLIKETGRLHSPVFAAPRMVIRDVEFAGYTIPAGTYVHLGLAAGHHLPTVFANPEVFDPDRFAPPREEDKRTHYGLTTFGGGLRLCIGFHFATIEIKLLAAHVLRFYRLEAIDNQIPKMTAFIGAGIPHPVRMRATEACPVL